ncbi:MAG: FtsX-like permease family protein [Bacteroidota bacterium]
MIRQEAFEFSFVDDDYNEKFASEVRVGKLATVFSALAILISLLGLFGMSAFVAERRTKEIGIRKVVGASILDLWRMLTKNFVALVALSCTIAFPDCVLLALALAYTVRLSHRYIDMDFRCCWLLARWE